MDLAGKNVDVVGIGVSTIDLLMTVDDLPAGEVVRRAQESALSGGGPVATALVALARLGARTAMVDRLGDDWRGRLIVEELQRKGVSTEYMLIAPGRTSSIASILVRARDGARAIAFSPGTSGELDPSDVPLDLISAAKILHLNGRHFEAAVAAAKYARERGVLVSFDGGAHRYSPQMRELVKLSDICIVARHFAFAFSGQEDLEASAHLLRDCGPKVVVITAGAEGCWVSDHAESCFHQPAFEMEKVVDTTGAGDAYHGAFLYGLVNNYSLRNCAAFASAVAALNTRSLGGRSALPSFAETRSFLTDRSFPLD